MNIKELHDQAYLKNIGWADEYLGIGKRQSADTELGDKLKIVWAKEDEKRRKTEADRLNAYQSYLNNGSLRKKEEFKKLVSLRSKKLSLSREIKNERKDIENHHKAYMAALDTLRDAENGVNTIVFSIEKIEAARETVRNAEKEKDFKLSNLKGLQADQLRIESDIKDVEKKLKKSYAAEQSPLLSELETILKRADQLNEKLKFQYQQISDVANVPALCVSSYSNKANAILKTGKEFINLYK